MPFGHNVEEEMVVIIARKVDEPANMSTALEEALAKIREMDEAEYSRIVKMIWAIVEGC